MAFTDALIGIFSFFRDTRRAALPANAPVILMGEDAAVVYASSATGIERRALLPWRSAGFDAAMKEVLEALKGGPAPVVLFNASSQKYRIAETPKEISWFDAPRFMKRKAEIELPEAVSRGWMRQPPNPDYKGLPRYLMAGLEKTAPLLRMAGIMKAAGITPAGCGTLPLESLSLMDELAAKLPRAGEKSRWIVMLAQHENGCLRQIIMQDGGLALTRVTPTPYMPGEPKWDEEAAREFNTSLVYMGRFGFKPEQGLDLIVLCDQADKEFFLKKPDSARNVNAVTVAEAMAAVLPGVLASPAAGNFADPLHAAWTQRFAALRVPLPWPQLAAAGKDGKTVH